MSWSPRWSSTTLILCVLTACTQDSQRLPFEVDSALVVQKTIPAGGGRISHPSGLSLVFPSGAFREATTVSIFVGLDLSDFPGQPEGRLVPGTYFNVIPADVALARPVAVTLAVPIGRLDSQDRVRIGLTTGTGSDVVAAEGVNLDLTSGLLHGSLSALGAIAAVVSENAVTVQPDEPPALGGGLFDVIGPSRATEGPTASAVARSGAPFTLRCGHTGIVRRCVRSGTMALWASSEIQDRLSGDMVVLNPDVTGSLDFFDFVNGLPTRAEGSLSVTGTLRVQLGQAVTALEIDDTFSTNGLGGSTSVTFQGNVFTLHSTSLGARTVEYEVRPAGTGAQLIVRGMKTVDFENDDGTTTSATLYIDLRLRR